MHKMDLYMGANFRKAFTLAELLLTLTIIGVVASLTIAPLMKNYQEKVWKIKWKKTYSTMAQTYMGLLGENGGTFVGAAGTGSNGTVSTNFAHICGEKLNVIKYCIPYHSFNTCWHERCTPKQLDGSDFCAPAGVSGFMLTNGVMCIHSIHYPLCTVDEWAGGYCGFMECDVNGFKGPNTMGKDIFYIKLMKHHIEPSGVHYNVNTCNDTSSGLGCSSEYLLK